MNTIILNQKNGAGRTGMERENYRKRELLSHPFDYEASLLKKHVCMYHIARSQLFQMS